MIGSLVGWRASIKFVGVPSGDFAWMSCKSVEGVIIGILRLGKAHGAHRIRQACNPNRWELRPTQLCDHLAIGKSAGVIQTCVPLCVGCLGVCVFTCV
jgi:hypothetical protein